MKIHNFEVKCEICGGKGVGTLATAGAVWETNKIVHHSNPNICIKNLKRGKNGN